MSEAGSVDARIRSEIDGAVAVLTLDRPEKLNALDEAMMAGIEAFVAATSRKRHSINIGSPSPRRAVAVERGWHGRVAADGGRHERAAHTQPDPRGACPTHGL